MAKGARARQGRARTYEDLVAFAEGEGYANPQAYAARILAKRAKRAEKPLLRQPSTDGLPRWGNPYQPTEKQ